MSITERGLRVDKTALSRSVIELQLESARIEEEVQEAVRPLRDKLKKPKLQWHVKRCPECKGGKKKKLTCESCEKTGKTESFWFNLGSPQQLGDALYNGLRLPKRTRDNKETVDEEALQSLLAHDKSGLVEQALKYNKIITMQEIYDRICPLRGDTVHTVLNPAGTLTGRFSSRKAFYVPNSTNLQNLPSFEAKRDPRFEVRKVIVPRPGRVFLYADLSQAEARVSAALAGDLELLERWKDPKWDIHTWTGSKIFGCSESEIGKEDPRRYLGKVARHALNYGMGPGRFWREVNSKADLSGVAITATKAKDVYNQYHSLHPGLKAWWKEVENRLLAGLPIETYWGRKIQFWPRTDRGAGEVDSDSLQSAIAAEPQSTIADLLNEGMLRVYRQEKALGVELVHQMHDAIVVETAPDNVERAASAIVESLEIPMVVRGVEVVIPAEVFVCTPTWADARRIR